MARAAKHTTLPVSPKVERRGEAETVNAHRLVSATPSATASRRACSRDACQSAIHGVLNDTVAVGESGHQSRAHHPGLETGKLGLQPLQRLRAPVATTQAGQLCVRVTTRAVWSTAHAPEQACVVDRRCLLEVAPQLHERGSRLVEERILLPDAVELPHAQGSASAGWFEDVRLSARTSMKSNTSFGSVQQSACGAQHVSLSCGAAGVCKSRGSRTHVLDPDAEVADVILVVLHLQQRVCALLQQLQQVAVPPALRESGPRPAYQPGAAGASRGARYVCSAAAAAAP